MQTGDAVGPYKVLGKIGQGGMGEVYRARDTALNRDVAIKVLPDLFARDADRLSRFTREAQTLAVLNHPNIAHIYGLEGGPGGARALVMELVDGDDLSARIAEGPLAVPDAIAIARQIADALEAAHDSGIIHRDLKPGNIKVRSDGTVKVLDFGLAKAMAAEGSGASADAMLSPTFTALPGRANTEAGRILGTAAYMAPEQARGLAVDRRADIWAFGVVLFEMLTGRCTFAGDTITDTLAAVLTTDPKWEALPAETPASVKRLLRRCLDRDVKRRLQAIGEARIVLADSPKPTSEAEPDAEPKRPRAILRLLPWAIAALALAAAAIPAWLDSGAASGRTDASYLDITLPRDVEPVPIMEAGFNISPDGRLVVVTGVRQGARRLHVRRLSSEGFIDVGESSGVTGSAFSPDSRRIAFISNNGLLVAVTLADQQRVTLARGADLAAGLVWGEPGLLFSRNGALWMVAADGSAERQLATLDPERREVFHTYPAFTPDGRTVLFTTFSGEAGEPRIDAVPVAGGPRMVVLERATTPLFSPTGHLLFARDGAVLAASFDPRAVRVTGEATTVIPKGQLSTTASGGLGIRLSRTGDLLVLPKNYQSRQLVSVGRDGSTRPLPLPPELYMNPRLSPDGRRVTVEASGLRIDALDLERETVFRLTPDAPGTLFSTWSRDGRHLYFRRYNAPRWLSTNGNNEQGAMPEGVSNDYPSGAGPDSGSVLVTRIGPQGAGDIMMLSREGRFPPKPLIATASYEGGAQLSPDGRWLVYVTTESGQSEIQVRRFPSLDRKWQVSAGYGVQPRWRHDGREIFFRDGSHMVAVPFDGTGEEPRIGRPAALFVDDYDLGQGITIANYDVSRENRFFMLRRSSAGTALRIVLNWTSELRTLLEQGGIR